MSTKFIFITGGVSSSLGKGITSAVLGGLLQSRGFKVILRKLDPYLNVDPGTMNPYQHGEVFVTADGMEADLDLGHYERFTGIATTKNDYITTGQVYSNVLQKERRGEYLGATVQVIPHITDEIKKFIVNDTQRADFVLCEIGGTVGDIEGLPYLEAIRQLRNDLGRKKVLFIHLTLLPYIATAGEIKTKPTQHSVKELLSVGIQADILVCRSDREISEEAIAKLALFCNVKKQDVIVALNADNIYQVPVNYHNAGLDARVCDYFDIISDKHQPNLQIWRDIISKINNPNKKVTIAIVGKYVSLKDSYKSLVEAITHATIQEQTALNIAWIDVESPDDLSKLQGVDGIVVAGGFGIRGIEGKIQAIKIGRENKIPTLGICLGMQLTIIEACRNVLGISNASSTEFGKTSEPVVDIMTNWVKDNDQKHIISTDNKGGTMRLGNYPCIIKENTLAYNAYNKNTEISERHRHRYEINLQYKEMLEDKGLIFSGMSPDGHLTEIVEWKGHPWFIAVQFHPEFQSMPFKPHPLFVNFIRSIIKNNEL